MNAMHKELEALRDRLRERAMRILNPGELENESAWLDDEADKLDALLREGGDDAARFDFMQFHRVGLQPEFEGPWDAEVYGEDALPTVYSGTTPRKAIDAAMAAITGDSR